MPTKLAAEIKKINTAKFASKSAVTISSVFATPSDFSGKIFSSCSVNLKRIIKLGALPKEAVYSSSSTNDADRYNKIYDYPIFLD